MSDKQVVRVRDVMNGNYQLVEGMLLVSEALTILRQTGSRVLVVNKRSKDDEYGIVLLTDIAREVLAVNRSPDRVNIYEIMSKPVVGVDPRMDIRYCARLFSKLGFSYAPVLDNGEIIGVIGYAEMLLST